MANEQKYTYEQVVGTFIATMILTDTLFSIAGTSDLSNMENGLDQTPQNVVNDIMNERVKELLNYIPQESIQLFFTISQDPKVGDITKAVMARVKNGGYAHEVQ